MRGVNYRGKPKGVLSHLVGYEMRSRVESALETGVRSKEEGNRGCTGWRVWRNLK